MTATAFFRNLIAAVPYRIHIVLDVSSQTLMVQSFPWNGRTHYGPGASRQRHDDSGNPSVARQLISQKSPRGEQYRSVKRA